VGVAVVAGAFLDNVGGQIARGGAQMRLRNRSSGLVSGESWDSCSLVVRFTCQRGRSGRCAVGEAPVTTMTIVSRLRAEDREVEYSGTARVLPPLKSQGIVKILPGLPESEGIDLVV
jgi:hypothetical protein